MKVLLLEPYTGVRVMMRGVLKAIDTKQIFEPKNSLEAMQILMTERVDFFICSDKVKPLNVILCHKLIRNASEEHIRHIRTIVSVENFEETQVRKLMDIGCDYILKKPFSADDITSKITRLIRKRAPFIECKVYVGPDRRKRQIPFTFEERRNADYNPGAMQFDYPLMKLLKLFFDHQMKKQKERNKERANDYLQKGILIEGENSEEKDLPVENLVEGMSMMTPVRAENGMIIVPSGHILDTKAISRIKDLVLADRLENKFKVFVTKE